MVEKALYGEINALCILILISLTIHLRKIDTSSRARYLSAVMISEALFFGTDFFWYIIDGNTSVPVCLNYFSNSLYFIFSVICPFLWLRYCLFTLTGKEISIKVDCITLIPAVMLATLSASAFSNGALFYIDSANVYRRGALYFLQPVISYLYLMFSFGFCIYEHFKSRSMVIREKALTLCLFAVLPCICGVLEILNQNLPLICAGVTISLIVIVFTIQKNFITHDMLTKISNRHSLFVYIEQVINSSKSSGRYAKCVSFIDVDAFKSINDRFGHAEGDNALLVVTSGLKDACRPQSAYCARFAGDEFVVVFTAETDEEAAKFNESIKECVRKAGENLPYSLTVSSGWARCSADIDFPSQVLDIADKNMYNDKNYGKGAEII